MKEPFFSARIDLPPGINDSYGIGYVPNAQGELKPHIVATAALKRFKELAAWQLKDAHVLVDRQAVETIQTAKKKKKHVPLEMNFIFYFNSRWRKDIDGGEKHVQDAVCKFLGLNDNLIVEKHTRKELDKSDPHVEIEMFIVQE